MNANDIANILNRAWPANAVAALLRSLGERAEFRHKGHATHEHWRNGTLGGALFSARCIVLVRRTPQFNYYKVTDLGRDVAKVMELHAA